MKRLTAMCLALVASGALFAQTLQPTLIAPDKLPWSVDAKTGVARADLLGARDRAGLFVQRMKMPAGFRAPRHTHDGPLNGTVLSGALHLRFGADGEERVVQAGGFLEIPAGLEHEEWATGETVIEVRGIGPQKTVPVAPKP